MRKMKAKKATPIKWKYVRMVNRKKMTVNLKAIAMMNNKIIQRKITLWRVNEIKNLYYY